MPARERYQEIVDRFDAVARANLGTLGESSEICDALGISQRTLSRAINAVHGTTPTRYLRRMRLAAARQALVSKEVAGGTVTEIALRFGFHELGRFAAEYRAIFGESPSETLQRANTGGKPRVHGSFRHCGF